MILGRTLCLCMSCGRQLCFIFQLNLIIKEIKPICETFFDKRHWKLQMSCQWLQVNDGDRARLVAGDQVLYEHETSQMNLYMVNIIYPTNIAFFFVLKS